jgi:hypothetical protein
MENVAGRDIVEAGNLCERKNGRGVDPNRNWDIDWGVKEKDYDPKEEYPGKAALRCVCDTDDPDRVCLHLTWQSVMQQNCDTKQL